MAERGDSESSGSPSKPRPMKERFENAVKVIRSLPEQGEFWLQEHRIGCAPCVSRTLTQGGHVPLPCRCSRPS